MNDLLNQLVKQADAEVAASETKKRTRKLDYVLLDGSGSMHGRWHTSLEAIDAYAKGLADAEVETKFVLTTFSGGFTGTVDYRVLRDSNAVALWSPLAHEPPQCPGGDTPLYDAINIMVRAARDENPDECSLVIVTDGEENGSRTTTADQARALLDWCRSRGWQVTFIGCDFNNAMQSRLLGADAANQIAAPTKKLSDLTKELAKKRGYHSKFGTPMHWSEEDKKNFGGYLSDNTGK